MSALEVRSPSPTRWRAALAASVVGALLATTEAHAQPIGYRLDTDATRVHLEVLHFGTSTIRARFDRIAGSVSLDRAGRAGEVSVAIDTGSISTGLGLFDNVLRRDDMLAAQDHPQAFYVAKRFEFNPQGRVQAVRGEFTLRGVGVPLTLLATRFDCRPDGEAARERCGGDFEGELKRSDFGITYGLPFVADRVRLLVQVEAVRD